MVQHLLNYQLTLESHRDSFRPNLIQIIINDLHEYVNCNVRLFADDCLLHWNVNNQSDSELLQKDLTNLENWEDMADEVQPRNMLCHPCYQEENSLKFNYKLHNHILQPVDNSKYLGVTISNDLD